MKNTCKKNLVSEVFKLIDEVDVVSFDIFDTLLLRAFVHICMLIFYMHIQVSL